MAATAWLILSFSSCIVCGFDSYREKFSLGTLEKCRIRIKSAHDTGTEGQYQPRRCSRQNPYVTSGIPQHGDSTTVDWLFRHTTQYTYWRQREYHTDTCKTEAGYFFVAYPVFCTSIPEWQFLGSVSDRYCYMFGYMQGGGRYPGILFWGGGGEDSETQLRTERTGIWER